MTMLTVEQLTELERRYMPKEPPPCRVCGAALTIADTGSRGETPKYACSSDAASMMKAKGHEAVNAAFEHRRASEWRPARRGDSLVIALIEEVRRNRPPFTAAVGGNALQEFDEVWRDRVLMGDGQVRVPDLALVLAQLAWLLNAVPKVYADVTGSRTANPFLTPETVRHLACEHAADVIQDGIRDELQQLRREITVHDLSIPEVLRLIGEHIKESEHG